MKFGALFLVADWSTLPPRQINAVQPGLSLLLLHTNTHTTTHTQSRKREKREKIKNNEKNEKYKLDKQFNALLQLMLTGSGLHISVETIFGVFVEKFRILKFGNNSDVDS